MKADFSAKYDGLIGPPCKTFTNARKNDGIGPLPLRGPSGPDRCGLVHLAGEVGQSQNRNFAGTEIGRSCDGHGDSLVVYVGGPVGLQEGGPRRLSAVDRRQDDSLGPTIQQG